MPCLSRSGPARLIKGFSNADKDEEGDDKTLESIGTTEVNTKCNR